LLGPVDYLIWVVSFALEVYILARAVASKDFLRYLSLHLFIAAMIFRDVSLYVTLKEYGYSSLQYNYAYYYTDALLTVMMYLAIMHLYYQVFREMRLAKYVRGATVLLLAGTALFAYVVVQANTGHLTSRFVVELSQDLYFVGLVLTYLLWAAVFKLRETRARLVQLVLALGVYFSATAALYAVRNMFPDLHALAFFLVPLVGIFLPAAWAFTFSRVSEETRLAPQRLAEGMVSHR
jgi:hypothetical protein